MRECILPLEKAVRMGYEKRRREGLIGKQFKNYSRGRKITIWVKVIDAPNGESYFESLMESKDRERRKEKPKKKNKWNSSFKHPAGKPTVWNCAAADLKPLKAVSRGTPQSAIHRAPRS